MIHSNMTHRKMLAALPAMLLTLTSLAMAIGAAELTYVTRKVENETFLSFESYLVATVLYLALSLVIMLAGARIAAHYRIPGVK